MTIGSKPRKRFASVNFFCFANKSNSPILCKVNAGYGVTDHPGIKISAHNNTEFKIMIFVNPLSIQSPLRDAITQATRIDENVCINNLLAKIDLPQDTLTHIENTAHNLVQLTRE